MSTSISSRLVAPDTRPWLVSLLGGGWILMSVFGILRAILLIATLEGHVEIGSQDPQARLAAEAPEYVSPEYFEYRDQQRERLRFQRIMAIPFFLACLGGLWGGVRLLRRQSQARSLLLVTGAFMILVIAASMIGMAKLILQSAPDVAIPGEFRTMLFSTTGINILVQSIPVVLGMSLLRHPLVARHMRG